MKNLFLFSVSSIALILSGCSDNPKITPPHKDPVKQTVKKQTPKDLTPFWVYDPSKPNQICAIGSTPNISGAKNKAFIKAKANIGKEIKIYIQSENTKSIKCTTKDCKISYKYFSNQQSSQMLNDIVITDRYVDNHNNRYYLRACTVKNDDIFSYTKPSKKMNIAPSLQTTKKSCIQQSAYPNKTLAQQKKILVNQAKQNSLEELYGTLIFSSTDIIDGKLDKDEIRSRAVGSVRIKGNPTFYNGSNLGEICANITSYITKEDIEKYSPKKVKLKRFCYVNSNMPLKKIKENAKYKAYIESIIKYKPSLKNISKAKATKLIHGFEISNDTLDFSSGAYCFDSVAILLPYELEMGKGSISSNNSFENISDVDSNNFINGLIATFYKENDYKMSKPLYQTYLESLVLEYKKLPFNQNIKKGIPYRIKITGYVKSDNKQNIDLKMYANVYEAKLYINDKQTLTHRDRTKIVTLNKGLNQVKLVLKTANSYDIKIVGGLEDIYTNKIKN